MCGLSQCQAVMERWPVLYACGCLCVKNLPARCLPMFSSSLEKSESWSCRARLGVWGLVPLIGFTSDAQTGWRYGTHTHTQNSRIGFEFHSFFTYDLWLHVIMRANYFLREIRKTLKTTVLWDESLDGGKDWTFICEHCAKCSVVVTGFWSNNQ